MYVYAYRNSVTLIPSHYYPVGHFHGSKIHGTVFRDSGSSLLPSSSFLLLEPFFHPVLFSATKTKLLLMVLPEAVVFCIFLRQMHNHKRYLGGAVSSFILFFGMMDSPSISHLNCCGVISLSSSSERGH